MAGDAHMGSTLSMIEGGEGVVRTSLEVVQEEISGGRLVDDICGVNIGL